jgi:hypothetical protein
MSGNHVQMRLDPAALAWLESRAERMHAGAGEQAKAEFALWRAVLAAEARRIRLTADQLACVADVIGGSGIEAAVASPVGRVFAQCYDAFRIARESPGGDLSSYGAKHGIAEQGLLDYLGSLGPAADHALADAISRWWDADLPATAEGFAVAGLKAA